VGLIAADETQQLDLARDLAARAEALAATCPPPPWFDGRIDQLQGIICITSGQAGAALGLARAGLERVTTARGRARLLNLVGMAATEEGDFDEAAAAFEAVGIIDRETGEVRSACIDLGNLAEVALRVGDLRRAAAHQLQGLDLALALGSLHLVSFAWIVAARL